MRIMGLEDVKKDILHQAEEQAASVVRAAREEAASILHHAKEESRQELKRAQERTATILATLERTAVSSLHAEVQRILAQASQDATNSVLAEAREGLVALPEGKRKEFLARLLKKIGEEIPIATIYANARDIPLLPSTLKAVPGTMMAGLRAENKDGTISVNCSVEELLSIFQAQKGAELSRMLLEGS